MADHSKFLALARKLINKDGREVQFLKIQPASADPDRPWKGPARTAGDPPPPSHIAVAMAVFLPDGAGFGKMIEDNDLFKTSDQMLLVAPHDDPSVNLAEYQLVEDGGVRWKINVIKELKPADLTVLFAMGVSR